MQSTKKVLKVSDEMTDDLTIELSQRLRSLELVQLKVYVPRPVEVALEELVIDLMHRCPALGDVPRGDLVGGLVRRAIDIRDDLSDVVSSYREAQVHEVLPNERRRRGPVVFPPRPRGRRARG